MTEWWRRIGGVLAMSLTWAAVWALVGGLIAVGSLLLPALPWNAIFEVFDAPLPALAVPGSIGGLIHAAVLGIAERRRRLEDLSLARATAWGAVAGLLLSLLPGGMVAVGLASIGRDGLGLWQLTAVISTPFALLGAASAVVAHMLATARRRRDVPEARSAEG